MAQLLSVVPIGFMAGLLAGAFGVGGGVIAVPMVRHFLGVSAHVAVGSTLAMIVPTALIGLINYRKQGSLLSSLSFLCSGPAVLGTVLASACSHYVPGQYLMILLSILMVIVGLDFVGDFGNKLKGRSEQAIDEFKIDRQSTLIGVGIGTIVGLLSGLLGIGGGFIMVPAFCYLLHLPLKTAFGTSLLVVTVVSIPGTLVHAYHGHVQPGVVLPMLLGSLPGSWLGSYLSLKAKDKNLRRIFGSLLLVLAIAFACRELNLQQ